MKNLFFTVGISLAVLSTASAQSEFLPRVTEKGHLINQYDDNGKKHGYWEAYVDENLELVDLKSNAAYIVLVFYNQGSNFYKGYFYDHSKLFNNISILPEFERGNPQLLHGNFLLKPKGKGQTSKYQFTKGYLDEIEINYTAYMHKKSWDYDKNQHEFKSIYNFKNQYNGIEGSFQVTEYKDGQINYAYWVRKINDKWFEAINCGLCSSSSDSSITINNQIWSKENLSTTTYRNGDEIYFAENAEDLERCIEEKIPAYSDFKGYRTYNWYALNDPRGLAPLGWRLPSDDDFDKLIEYLGADHVYFLRSLSYSKEMNKLGFNLSGFDGTGKTSKGPWWSLDADDGEHAHAWMLGDDALKYEKELQCTFYAVRCIKED
jgi:uncharacterized protein (TIGR02145 family)